MIFEKKGVDPASQRLVYTTKELVDTNTLAYYEIVALSTLRMALRLLEVIARS